MKGGSTPQKSARRVKQLLPSAAVKFLQHCLNKPIMYFGDRHQSKHEKLGQTSVVPCGTTTEGMIKDEKNYTQCLQYPRSTSALSKQCILSRKSFVAGPGNFLTAIVYIQSLAIRNLFPSARTFLYSHCTRAMKNLKKNYTTEKTKKSINQLGMAFLTYYLKGWWSHLEKAQMNRLACQ